jgi:hypothetical protein
MATKPISEPPQGIDPLPMRLAYGDNRGLPGNRY